MNDLPRYISVTVLTRLENDAPLNLSHREGDLMKHKVFLMEKEGKLVIKAKRSGNAVKSAHRRGIMETNGIAFTTCNPSTVIGEEAQCCTKCKACTIHGYATAKVRRSSLIHVTDMISVEADIVKSFRAEPSELANIMSSLEMAPREVVKIEQHLALPPGEKETPMPFRVEKVQAGTHFVNALLLEIPFLPKEKGEELAKPDSKLMEIYGKEKKDFALAVREMIYDVVKALPYIYFNGFAMETRNRPIFTPLRTILNVVYDVSKSKTPPIIFPPTELTDIVEVTKWFDGFEKINANGQKIYLMKEKVNDIMKLRDKIQENLKTLLEKS